MASHYQRQNGTYCVRVSNGLIGNRQQLVSITYKPKPGMSKAEVLADLDYFEKKFERAVHDGVFLPGMKTRINDPYFAEMPLGKFIEDIYYPNIEVKLSPNTVRFYHNVCEHFLIPSFGMIRLCDISHHNLQSFIDFLAYRVERKDGSGIVGLSPGSVKRYATVFRSVMTEACRSGYIENNPLRHDSITYPKIREKGLDVYNPDEVKAFYSSLLTEPPMIRLLLMTALFLGLRRGEIVALKWSDIDFESKSLTVSKSAFKIKDKEQGLKAPKSQHGNRTVFYPGLYGKALKEWLTEQQNIRDKAGYKWIDKDFIFTTDCGSMISVYTPTNICADFEKRHGLRHLKLHGLRHTCGSLLVALGTDPETVRDMLGHESVKMTDQYIHPYDQFKKKAANQIEMLMEEETVETQNDSKNGGQGQRI